MAPVRVDRHHADPGVIGDRACLHQSDDLVAVDGDHAGRTGGDVTDELGDVGRLGVREPAALLEQSNS
jgi:hypothetical protein